MDIELHHAAVTVLCRVWGFCLSYNRDPQIEAWGIHKPTLWKDQEQCTAQQGWQQRAQKRAKEGSRTRGMAGIGATSPPCYCSHLSLQALPPVPCWSCHHQTHSSPRVWSWHRPVLTPDPVSGLCWPRVQSCTLPSTFMQKASTPHVFPLYLRPCEILAEVDGFCPEYTI